MALLFALMASSAGAFVRSVAPKASAQDPTWILGLGWRIVHSAQLWVLTQPRAAQLLPSALRLPTGGPSAFHSTIPLASLLLRGKPVLGCPPCPPSSLCGNLHTFSVKGWMYMYFRFCGPHTISVAAAAVFPFFGNPLQM